MQLLRTRSRLLPTRPQHSFPIWDKTIFCIKIHTQTSLSPPAPTAAQAMAARSLSPFRDFHDVRLWSALESTQQKNGNFNRRTAAAAAPLPARRRAEAMRSETNHFGKGRRGCIFSAVARALFKEADRLPENRFVFFNLNKTKLYCKSRSASLKKRLHRPDDHAGRGW